jgi:hypothetical protein
MQTKELPYTEEELREICKRTERQAKRLASKGLPVGINEDDLFSAGQEAVVKALKSYDPDSGIPIFGYTAKASIRAMMKVLNKERKKESRQKPLICVNNEGEEYFITHDKKADDPAELVGAKEAFSGKKNAYTLTEVRASMPSALETAQKVEKLRNAIYGSISETDVQKVVSTVLASAKSGNIPAARLVLDMIVNGSKSVNIKHTVVQNPPLLD